MSQFLPEAPSRNVKVPDKGIETPLTPQEIELQRRLLGSPETFPDKLKSWLVEYVAVNGALIPSSQIQGFSQLTPIQSQVLTNEGTSSTSYTNLATTGPEVTGLADGTYLLIFGAVFDSSGPDGYMSPSVNGASPSDNDAAFQQPAAANRFNIARAVTKSIANNNNNTITMKYRVTSGAPSFKYRWMVALRTGS